MFDPTFRQRALAGIARPFDLVIVGGGITGCGVLLDAAQRGLRALLVEKGDLASGTSSRSSKLIHGGLRYLKQMQLRITRLACRERDRLLQLSPHLVQPVSFLYPAYEGDRTPGWQVGIGLWMYDRLTQRPERHREVEAAEAQRLAPGLEIEGLDRALVYGDAFADDARLTIAVAATAAAYGGLVLPRAEAIDAHRDAAGKVDGVVVRDLLSGDAHRVDAAVVLNATGHWTDAVRERFGLAGRRLRPSRGVHVVLPASLLPIEAALTVASPDDGRPVFFIPHPEGVLVGTTDLFHDGGLDDPRPTRAEVDYLLRVAMTAFPGRVTNASQVRGAFAGLRPILQSHADTPSEASRDEEVWEEEGLLNVAGGKLTTYRSTAEEVVDEVVKRLPPERARRVGECATAGTPLAGLAPADLPERLRERGVAAPVAAAMSRRLGSLAWTAAALARSRDELHPLVDDVDLTAAEVRAQLRHGAVLRLEDLLVRRARLAMWDPPTARAVVPRLGAIFRDELGWSGPRWEAEEESFAAALFAWTPEGVVEA
ncbi:MAG TPA: glycerol-3-phosphate dehydrogenase/oxidase [Thermoanaerobaculia bacterium]|nr:glycerol-3-phosphate dehydrogenase/oxidase [Thermoanaerobaculia bacterium]